MHVTTPTTATFAHSGSDLSDCQTCRGLGWLNPGVSDPTDQRFGLLEPCPACKHEQRERYERRKMVILRECIARHTAMTPSLRQCTFDTFDTWADRSAVPAYSATVRWARREVPWVHMYGPPGCGMTHLAAAAVNYLRARDRAALFAMALNLLAMVRSSFDDGRSQQLVKLCARVPWLVLDDLGAERLTDWVIEVWFRIFNTRYIARARTFAASKVERAKTGEPRLASRFEDGELCLIVPNGAGDYRKRKARDW